MAQIHELTMIELAAAIRAGELSPVAVTDHYLRRTTELNEQTGAFYTITPEFAADQARAAEKAVADADDKAALPPLTGVPIPIKDLNMVAGVRQTLGSKAFEANVPDADDNVVVYIKQAGAVITGKTATPEFGLPCYTETAVGPHAVGSDPVGGRVERRRGRRGGGGPGPGRPGQRRRRLHPHPVQRVRPVRDQADPRPRLRGPARARPVRPGGQRPARAHRRGRGAAARR